MTKPAPADLIIAKYRAQKFAESAALAYWTEQEFHIEQMRDALAGLLCFPPETGQSHDKSAEEELFDILEAAIADSIDMDWEPRHAAAAVIDALFDPLRLKGEEE